MVYHQYMSIPQQIQHTGRVIGHILVHSWTLLVILGTLELNEALNRHFSGFDDLFGHLDESSFTAR